MATTITVSEDFRDEIYDRKRRDQSYEDYLRDELGMEEQENAQ